MESLTNSCAPVHPLSEPGAVELAVSNVAERSFFAFAEPAESAMVSELTANGAALSAGVAFSGPASGAMHVTMPVALVRELAQQFSGDPDIDFSDADLVDMAGEFANMVTGAWLTSTDPSSTYDLTAPVVTTVTAAPAATLVMQINYQPVALAWQVE